MNQQQKRKMERNSKKKQTNKFNIFSISMVDTKSIIENKDQFIFTDEEYLKNHLKKNQKLMETKVLVNFGSETQNNFGIVNIIHDHINDSDFESLIKSAIDSILDICLEINFESILQDLSEIDVICYVTKKLTLDSSKSIQENINNKAIQTVIELIKYDDKTSEAA
jgi:hypothetical protein